MLTGVCILILVLYAITLPIRPEIAFSADFLRNDGSASVSFAGIKIFSLAVKFCRDCGCGAITAKGKIFNLEIRLNNDKEDKKSIRHAADVKYFPIIPVEEISVKTRIGKSDDALATTMATSLARGAIGSFANALVRAQGTKASIDCEAEYGSDAFFVSVDGIIAVSFADIIYELIAFFAAKIKAARKTQTKRRGRIGI